MKSKFAQLHNINDEVRNITYKPSMCLTFHKGNWNFYPLEVVSRWRDPQLQVIEN